MRSATGSARRSFNWSILSAKLGRAAVVGLEVGECPRTAGGPSAASAETLSARDSPERTAEIN